MIKKILNNKIIKILIRYFLPIIIILFIILNVDINSLQVVLKNVDSSLLLMGFLGTLFQFISYSFRWNLILSFIKIDYRIWKAFQVYLANFFIGSFVPGTFGGFLKVFHLTRDGWPADKGIISVVFEKVYEIFFTAFFALLMILLVPDLLKISLGNLYLNSIILIIVFFTFYLVRKPILNFLHKIIVTRVENNGIVLQTTNILESIDALLSLRNTVMLIFVSFLVRLGEAFAFFFIAKSLGSNILFLQAMFFSAVIAIVTSLPVSFSGIGTRDIVMIMLLATIGDSKETALGISLLILISIILMRIIGMVFWLNDPITKERSIPKTLN